MTIFSIGVMLYILERDNINPSYKLLWVIIMMLLPVTGAAFFFLWGDTKLTRKQQAYLKKFAQKHKLLTTGGSDFHGLYNTYKVSLGDYSTPDDCLHALLSYKSKQKRLQKKLAQQSADE